jgi:2-methylaconitate cis-trans-isomerase PrpF
METDRLPAAFVRGGTSKAVVFKGSDLPASKTLRDRIFCHVLGSPDPYGRQLDGLGGGLSSLSKVVIVEPSGRTDADVDYTFVQVAVDRPVADYAGMCGNMSAAVGPFAVDEGMITVDGEWTTVRVYNTNTDKLFNATFPIKNGRALEHGDFEIPGVSGTGARIKLDYFAPGGAATGTLLPSGNARDQLNVDGIGTIEVSLVDASNPVAFVRAVDLDKTALEAPEDLDADTTLMATLEHIRRASSVAMGMSATADTAALSNPKIAIVGAPGNFTALDGRRYESASYHISVRIVSMGNVHRAVTLTGAMCLAAAARIPGTIAHELAVAGEPTLVGNPAGLLPVEADVRARSVGYEALCATTYRTQRRIMEGCVLIPSTLLLEIK